MDGAITLRLEIDLGWGEGGHDGPSSSHLSVDGTPGRASLERLLDHCDDQAIPITVDIVGHLVEKDCERRRFQTDRDATAESAS